jgi:hypothetical protein
VSVQWKESIIVPISKKGCKIDCRSANYRGMLLLSTAYKILSDILLYRLTPYVDEIIRDQCGFRCDQSTTEQIFCIRQTLDKKLECSGLVHQIFINFKNAYDSGRREVLYNILIEYGVPLNRLC